MKDFVLTETHNGITTITFGTAKSNALPSVILEQLAEEITSAGQNPNTTIILLKSHGERAFCAGASFDELLAIKDLETSKHFFGGFAKVLTAMKNCGKIIITRVQGKITGGGVGIACASDYCFATEHAALALTEINLGIGPFVIGPYVERKIGTSQFTAMALDADFRTAQWAKDHHIYHHISPDISSMDDAIKTFTEKLAQQSKDALSLIKKISWEGTEHFEKLMPERIQMSASLVLEETAKQRIEAIKLQLKK